MLYNLFSLIIVLPVLMGFGHIFQHLFGKIWQGLSSQIISGILFLMIIWHILAFFIPMGLEVEIASIVVGLGSFFYFRLYHFFWKFTSEEGIILGYLILTTTFFSSYYPFILDHFGYYVPTIKWLCEFGLVKGITNLDWILGQMSPWHIFQAGFSHFADPFLRINSVLLIGFFIYVVEKRQWVMLCFSPIFFLFLQSPSPDLPAIAIALIILNEIWLKNPKSHLLLALSVLVFSIKPTMIWLPVLSFLYPVLILKQNLKFIGLGSCVLALYFIKNIWVFGYPFFPLPFFDFGLSWQPYENLFSESSQIAIQKTYDMRYSIDEINRFSTWDFIKNWLFLPGVKGVLHVIFVFALMVFGIFSIKKKNKIYTLIFFSILLKSIIVILFSAQYRFFIDVFFVIFILLFYSFFSKKNALLVFNVLSIAMLIFFTFPNTLKTLVPSFKLGHYMSGFNKNQFWKPSYFELNRFESYHIGNLRFNLVKDYPFCFDTPLPALSPDQLEEYLKLNIFPQQIGNTLQSGFVWKHLNHQEKRQLQFIIHINKQEKR